MAIFFSSRRRHTSYIGDWSSDVCSSDLLRPPGVHVDQPGQLGQPGDLALHVRDVADVGHADERDQRSEERRVGKEWRARRSRLLLTKILMLTRVILRVRIQITLSLTIIC